jgi:hypothetical protein
MRYSVPSAKDELHQHHAVLSASLETDRAKNTNATIDVRWTIERGNAVCQEVCIQGAAAMRDEKKKECLRRFAVLLNAISPGWIAGGAIRDHFASQTIESDIDVFFKSHDDYQNTINQLVNDRRFEKQYIHKELACFVWRGMDVQLIGTHFFPGPKETMESFDFTVCCCALDLNEIYMHEHFMEDLAARRLAINKLSFPLSTMERLQKYSKKGFTACNGTLLEVAKAIKGVDFEDTKNVLSFYPNGGARFMRFD